MRWKDYLSHRHLDLKVSNRTKRNTSLWYCDRDEEIHRETFSRNIHSKSMETSAQKKR